MAQDPIKIMDGINVDTVSSNSTMLGVVTLIYIFATSFGGGTITIENSVDGGVTWIPLKLYTNSDADEIIALAENSLLRARLTGSGGASNVNVWIYPRKQK